MARVTIEDCIEQVPNRFDLVLLAAQRAHDLYAGAVATVPIERDKPTVLALREIAANTIDLAGLRARVTARLRRVGSLTAAAENGSVTDFEREDRPAFDAMTEDELLTRLREDGGFEAPLVDSDDD